MRWFAGLMLLGACGRIDFDPLGEQRRECTAQRVVHLSGGSGGLAWFTLVWPMPAVITGFQPTYSYDDPTRALAATSDPQHLLFAREIDGLPLWTGNVTAFIAGTNEAHTSTPFTAITARSSHALAAAGAAAQAGLAPALPVLAFSGSGFYGTAPGAPPPITVTTIDDAINALRAVTPISIELEQQLRPDPVEVATWYAPGASTLVVSMAEQLAFAANAFRLGLIGTVMIPALRDDPHGVFVDLPAVTARADDLTRMLARFDAQLATAEEPACVRAGQPLQLVDNVMVIVTGDTHKNPFARVGWGDGTPDGSNVMYVRSNGFLVPGWFGDLQPVPPSRRDFDPLTGLASPTATRGDATEAAIAGTLHAIARGDRAAVEAITTAPYAGVLAEP